MGFKNLAILCDTKKREREKDNEIRSRYSREITKKRTSVHYPLSWLLVYDSINKFMLHSFLPRKDAETRVDVFARFEMKRCVYSSFKLNVADVRCCCKVLAVDWIDSISDGWMDGWMTEWCGSQGLMMLDDF